MTADAPVRPSADDVPAAPSTGTVEQVHRAARCHACADGVVVAICSRCARLLCPVHDFAAGPLGPRAVLQLFRGDSDDPTGATPPKDAGRKPKDTGKKEPAAGRAPRGTGTTADDTPAQDADGTGADRDGTRQADPDKPGPTSTGGGDRKAAAKTDSRPTDRRRRERPRGTAQRHYCAECVPQARPYDAELVAAATTAGLGVTVLPVQPVLGGLLLCAGVVRCGVRVVLDLRRRSRPSAERNADLVLNPNLRRVKARELIRGTLRLTDERQYETTVDPVMGSVRIEGNWGRMHRAELVRHRRRTRTDPTTVAAGHLVLHGPARVAFRPVSDAAANGGPALVLEPRIADQEVLHTPDGHGDTRWRSEFRYDISPPDEGWTFPVWLTPNIAANLERHVLELHLQWCTRKPERPHTGVPLRAIEELELNVPAHWGTVEYVTDHGGDDLLIGPPEPDEHDGIGRRTLTWKKIRLTDGKDRGVRRFTVRFSDTIDVDHDLTGRIKARFGGAVSGLTRVGLYRTDGAPVTRLAGAASPQTIVDLTFDLSLKGLRYQQQRVVPDRSRAEDVHRRESHTFPGVAPDHRTVALLTNNLADEGYYVIRVLENPAQPGPRSGTVNRLWDLVGRFYEGVYPIDFHLVLSGEEIHKGQEVTGETSVLLNVAGSYANDVMEERLVEEWNRLWKRIRLSLRAAGGEPRLTTEPLDTPSSELARLRNVMVTETARLSAAADAGRMDPGLSTEMVSRLTREFGLSEG